MKSEKEVLYSDYIIDGARMDASPAEILSDCLTSLLSASVPEIGEIADESLDPAPSSKRKAADAATVAAEAGKGRRFDTIFPESFTRQRIALALIGKIWDKGRFRLQDLSLTLGWRWDSDILGNMSAFYYSCSAAADFIYGLGIELDGISYRAERGGASLDCTVEGGNPENARKCPSKALDGPAYRLIYIPFDDCPYRLGGSVYSGLAGGNGDISPDFGDPDYFMDCYEVVRELIEDRIIVSGITVGDGGLAAAAENFCNGSALNISSIKSAYGEKDSDRILFGEIPGVLVQINSGDLDYFDSQMILQDIAYFQVSDSGRPALGNILAALLDQATEGED